MKVRTEARREAIVKEAKQLFLEMGYERATMDALTKRLGGSKSTLYGYFKSKQELFAAVTETMAALHLTAAEAELDQLATSGLEAGLTRYAETLLLAMVEDEGLELQRMILSDSGRTEVGETFLALGPNRAIDTLARALQAAMDRGDMARGPARLLSMQLLALVRTEIDLRVFERQPAPLQVPQLHAMARRAVQMFLGGCNAVTDGD